MCRLFGTEITESGVRPQRSKALPFRQAQGPEPVEGLCDLLPGLSALWYVMQNPTNPVSCKVLTPRKGNQAGSSADVRAGAIPPTKFGGCAEASRSVKRTRIGLVTHMRVTKLPEMLKSVSAGKWFPRAPAGLSGVKGGGAPRRGGWEHERAVAAIWAFRPGKPDSGINNRVGCCDWQSERPVVAVKRVMTVERRGLGVSGADSEVRVV